MYSFSWKKVLLKKKTAQTALWCLGLILSRQKVNMRNIRPCQTQLKYSSINVNLCGFKCRLPV